MSNKFMAIGYDHNNSVTICFVGSKKKCKEQTLIWDRHPSYSRSCITTKEDGEKLLEIAKSNGSFKGDKTRFSREART